MKTIFALIFTILCTDPVFAWEAKQFKKPTPAELKAKLSDLQFRVTQKSDTETPFMNEFWNHHKDGIYVDIVSGEPLFSSLDKYDSKTGWPSFTKPISKEAITTREDRGLTSVRTEVRSRLADSHLGHVFDDGPPPTGKRYCMNSASLRFVPADKLVASGYAEYAGLFAKASPDKKPASDPNQAQIVLAGGCFWCMQPPYDALIGKGVISVSVGFTGGTKPNPTYEEVSTGATGHREVVAVKYDPAKISLDSLLDIYWMNIDPYDKNGQFCDKGEQYRSAIYVHDDKERQAVTKSMERAKKNSRIRGDFLTQVLPAAEFYQAEDYHQAYYKKNALKYKFYRTSCGRDRRLKEIWGAKAGH